MKHRLYMRDWYFNAGIVGFLTIVADGRSLDEVEHLHVGENYVEFDDAIFDNFGDKFVKHAFAKFFNVQAYCQRFKKARKEIQGKKQLMTKAQIDKKLAELEKSPYLNFLSLLGYSPNSIETQDDYAAYLDATVEKLKGLTKDGVFQALNKTQEGKDSIQSFISSKFALKGVCAHDKADEYIKDIKKRPPVKTIKNTDLCVSCQTKKAEYEFSNAISNIIGFNKDNSNWIWGCKAQKVKVCPLCALIYNSAFDSLIYVLRRSDYLKYFYFVNQNTDLQTLYESTVSFNTQLNIITDKTETNVIIAMIKETVRHIRTRQVKDTSENINFIEVSDNPIAGGQSTKGYNTYNYNISVDIARFLDEQFTKDKIPKGFYKIKKTFYSIEEELLLYAINRQIGYATLDRYFSYYLDESGKYNLYKVTNYIISYIQTIRGQKDMGNSQKIVKKGYRSGITLRQELHRRNKDNQINGIAYGFLNDLKLADREKFLDKYMRVMMSNDLSLAFGQDEMLDDDYFMQFGYSFLNGLLASEKDNNTDNSKQGG
ncbi:type I-B CRISPR-associated protein Cas8b1/Cst1 [Candidatus Magnetobacterium casense]|uniref:type I-B CRISPR-associated protein Cas8b1/Cst1 n=1 Tax=Candidatus Magnetobacterium casense TaxID=1455061 RepID=UPI0005907791|nr:type I-B CRISPR-associated protein Cas8b1/Cst1 [Candidatus Magnetobacterium casensis]